MSKPMPAETFRTPQDAPTPLRSRTGSIGWLALVVLVGGLSYGAGRSVTAESVAEATTAARTSMVPTVRTITAQHLTGSVPLDLPGSIEPFETATIFGRASGYIAQRFVDIGSQVKSGDVLAIIRSPELDQQVSQAEASLAQAKANLELAHATSQRSSSLVKQGWTTGQKYDEDRLAESARIADRQAAEASLAAITQRRDYLTVTAPFDGVVTARNVEIGDLVSADTTTARPLFSVARTDKLRVQVHVPQDAADTLDDGVAASVAVPQLPGQTFKALVARTAHALDASTRTLLVEVDIDNPKNTLAAGTYVQVHFDLTPANPRVRIDANTLIYGADGLKVAVVENGHVRLVPITIKRDFGAEIEIAKGLSGGETIVLNPSASLQEGREVRVAVN